MLLYIKIADGDDIIVVKKCAWCGEEYEPTHWSQKYCEEHKKEARKEVLRKARRKYYNLNKKRIILKQIGTTTMSPHRNPDFIREKEIVGNEVKRCGMTTVYKGKGSYFKGRMKYTFLIPGSDEVQLGTQITHNYGTFEDYVSTSTNYWMTSQGPCPECGSSKHLKDNSRCEVACECGLLLSGAPHPSFVYPDDNYDKIPFAKYSHEVRNIKAFKGY